MLRALPSLISFGSKTNALALQHESGWHGTLEDYEMPNIKQKVPSISMLAGRLF